MKENGQSLRSFVLSSPVLIEIQWTILQDTRRYDRRFVRLLRPLVGRTLYAFKAAQKTKYSQSRMMAS